MRTLRQSIARSWFPELRELKPILAPALGLRSPLSLIEFTHLFDTVEERRFSAPIDTDAMHGEAEFIIDSTGRYHFRGSVRATGVPSFAYKVQATLRTVGGAVIVVEASGEVFGLDTPKHSESHWDEAASTLQIRRFWTDIRMGATFVTDTQKEVIGSIGAIVSVAETVVEVYVAAQFRGLIGVVIVLGIKLGTVSGTTFVNPNILAGVTVGAGVLILFGPSAIVPALVAGTGTALIANIRSRNLLDSEINFANQVFKGTLPFDRILITDLYNPGTNSAGQPIDREFTFPAIDGGIWVNMGKNFGEPLGPDANGRTNYGKRGQVFIHELTHAWQIANKNIATVTCGALSNANYNFGRERVDRGVPFGEFGPEEQGAIVDQWFGAFAVNLATAEALRDPKFRYIEHNIRTGTT